MRRAELRADRAGATAVEFAMVATALLALVFGILEMGWQTLGATALEFGTSEAARFATTGATTPNVTLAAGESPPPTDRAGAVAWMIGHSTGYFVSSNNGANLTVTSTSYACGAHAISGQGGSGPSNPGTSGQTTIYNVTFFQPYLTGTFAETLFGGSGLTHTTKIIVQNEPYASTPSSC